VPQIALLELVAITGLQIVDAGLTTSILSWSEYHEIVSFTYQWRGVFENSEVNDLHRDAFEFRVDDPSVTDWELMLERHSLGWVTARDGAHLVGFVNVIWDGRTHAWIQDVMVNSASRNLGIGSRLVTTACAATRSAGCEWLHVDFDARLANFYFACGFEPTTAGLIRLR
jgi:GNAT superfamily N-acetyltransferase